VIDNASRCHLCQQPLDEDYVTTPNGLTWCPDLPACKSRARRRLGVSSRVDRGMLARDRQEGARA
jgi:hypothetical protein